MPFLAVAAIASGAAVATGVVAASTMAMVGVGLSVVGKITKSKELMQIGGGIGLGAGVASLASSVFGAGEAAANTAGALDSAASGSVESLSAAESTSSLGDVAESISAASPVSGNIDSLTAGVEGGATAPTGGGGLLTATAPPAQPVASVGPLDPNAAKAPWMTSPTSATNPYGLDNFGISQIAPPPGTDSGSIAKWWASQPETTKTKILQVGGQAVGGLFDGWTQDQKMALEREKMNLTTQNASAQPKVAFQNYTPAKTPGLLNASRG